MYIKIYPPINLGSYGTTYYARNIEDKRLYVIKEVNLRKVNIGQLYMEVDSLMKIRDKICRDDILCIKEYYVDFEEQMFNIVTETFIREDIYPITLREYLTNKKYKLKRWEILLIILNIVEAVSYLHEMGMAHGDIKPENILINHKLDIQLIDFGLSCTRECILGGTRKYLSPEEERDIEKGKVVRGRGEEEESDKYSIGKIGVEMGGREERGEGKEGERRRVGGIIGRMLRGGEIREIREELREEYKKVMIEE